MNAWGGSAQDITGPGPYVFRFQPVSKPGLSSFIVTAWLTPSGEWSDKSQVARYQVALGRTSAPAGRSPQVRATNFLLETYFRTEPGETDGVLIEKMADAGYSLAVDRKGHLSFSVRSGKSAAEISSRAQVNNGRWHHVIAEADRGSKTLTLYVDGSRDTVGAGIGPDVSLANESSLHLGGTPAGRHLAGTLEFARIALGTLTDAKTTIQELYAWQFDGPFLRDWNDRKAGEGQRAAGAIDLGGQ